MPELNGIDVAVGANVRRLREMAGLTTEVLAGAAGLEAAVLEVAEGGRRRLRASELYRISVALHVPAGRFYEGLASAGPLALGSVSQGGDRGWHVELERR